jgi:hypothetical protein
LRLAEPILLEVQQREQEIFEYLIRDSQPLEASQPFLSIHCATYRLSRVPLCLIDAYIAEVGCDFMKQYLDRLT